MQKYQSFLTIAKKAAHAAARIHCVYFNDDALILKDKHDQSYNKVTEADLEAENAIVKVIRESFPDHNFLCEEKKYSLTASPYTWIIDPLDGTNNFASGIPMFSVSIALVKDDEVVVGLVYDVSRDEMFTAILKQGAWLNDKPIYVNKASLLTQSILITGFYYDRGEAMRNNLNKIQLFFEHEVIGIRRFGSAALDLCYVASGRVSGFWEFTLHPWDYAAGMLIVQEAGGMVTNLEKKALPIFNKSYVVASNGNIHMSMLEILQ